MFSFFSGQLDYIYFFYGLAFILLAVLCAPLYFEQQKQSLLPWKYLGLFGLIHGVNEWLDLTALAFGDYPAFFVLRLVTMAASFLALVEFARQGWVRLYGSGLPLWIHGVLIFLSFIGIFFELQGLNATIRYFVGLSGALGSSIVVMIYQHRFEPKVRSLLVIAGALFLYSIAAGLIVPANPFFPARHLNAQNFSVWTGGIPIQLLRGFLAIVMAVGAWEYFLGLKVRKAAEAGEKSIVLFRWLGVGTVLVIICGWILTEIAGSYGRIRDEIPREAQFQRSKEILFDALEEAENAALTFADFDEIREVLETPNAKTRFRANRTVDRIIRLTRSSLVYLLNQHGEGVASTNRAGPDSLIGKIYSARPYFERAMRGESNQYVGVGITTLEPGYYFSVPVQGKAGKTLGVLVVKVTLSDLRLIAQGSDKGFLVDRDGKVLVSNVETAVFHDLWPSTREQAGRSIFGTRPRQGELFQWNKTAYEVREASDPRGLLTLISLSPAVALHFYRYFAIAFTLLIALFFIGFFVSRQRELASQYELENSERRYRSIFEENHAVMLLIEPRTGKIEDANPSAASFYGYTRDELRAMYIFDLNKRPREKVLEAMAKVIEQGRAHFEFTHRLASGESRVVDVYSMKMRIRGNELLFSIIHDVTERVRMENERDRMRTQLFHTEKLASIGTLAAGVGHEINNPLTVVRGFADVLRSRLEGVAEFGDCLVMLAKQEKALDRIAKIVNGLRTYARADTDHIEAVNIHESLEETLGLLDQILRKAGIDIELRLQSAHPLVRGNHGKFQQVVMNLLTNARDALESKAENRKIVISTHDVGAQIVMRFEDNGSGIPPEILARIFDPFFTTKPPGKGTGLGLPICRTIIEGFGGSLAIESKKDKATVASLFLPQARASGAAHPALVGDVRYSGQILVVDDEADIREILREFLVSLGFGVTEAEDGLRGLELLKKKKFDFAIVDIRMPEMDGDRMIETAKADPAIHQPVYIVTSGGILTQYAPERREWIRTRVNGYLRKPFDRDDLIKLFQSIQAATCNRS